MSRRGSSCSDSEPGSPSAAGRLVGLLALMLALATLFAPAAGAESPVEVAEELLTDGVYLAPGRGDIDSTGLADAVRQARARGLRLVIVAPIDPEPDPAAFARRIQEAADADAAIVFALGGGIEANVVSEFDSAHLRALAAARSKATPVAAVEAYTEELLTEPSRSVPPIVGQTIRAVVALAVVLTIAVAVEQWLRRLRHDRRTQGRTPSEQARSGA